MAVAMGMETAEPIFDQAQPGEDHRFVRAFTERFTNAEEKDADEQKNQLVW